MGVRSWWAGLIAAAIISAITASGAPVVAAAEATQGLMWADVSSTTGLTAEDADKAVATTPRTQAPDALTLRWSCKQPIRIYYTAPSNADLARVRHELEYPVRYLRDLGYDVTIVRAVAYQPDYPVTRIGDVLLVAAANDARAARLDGEDLLALTEPMALGPTITSAQVTVATEGITSTVLLHEFGHVLGLPHKDGSVMGVTGASSLGFDPSETAAVDCR